MLTTYEWYTDDWKLAACSQYSLLIRCNCSSLNSNKIPIRLASSEKFIR